MFQIPYIKGLDIFFSGSYYSLISLPWCHRLKKINVSTMLEAGTNRDRTSWNHKPQMYYFTRKSFYFTLKTLVTVRSATCFHTPFPERSQTLFFHSSNTNFNHKLKHRSREGDTGLTLMTLFGSLFSV